MPGDITINLIKKAMQNQGWSSKKFLIDGFPRSQENKDGWDKLMGPFVDMRFVLFLECDEDKLIDRINARSAASGTAKREDDNIEVLRKRFHVYRDQSMPIVDFYSQLDMVRRIDANGTKDEVWQQVVQAFEGYL